MNITQLQELIEKGLAKTGLSERQASLRAVGRADFIHGIKKGSMPGLDKALKLLDVLNIDIKVGPTDYDKNLNKTPFNSEKKESKSETPTADCSKINRELGLEDDANLDDILIAITQLKQPRLWSSGALPDDAMLARALCELDEQSFFGSSSLDRAEEIIWDENVLDGDTLLKVAAAFRAIEISPLCAQAYLNLVDYLHLDDFEEKNLVDIAVEAGERAIAPQTFIEDRGHFWSILKTRPYIRARFQRAEWARRMCKWQEAAEEYQAIMEFNKNDNLGCRHLLMICLLHLNDKDELLKLSEQHEDERSAIVLYTRPLLAFKYQDPNSSAAHNLARQALKANRYVPLELYRYDGFIYNIDKYALGSEDEAMHYSDLFGRFWHKTEGAVDWLLDVTGTRDSVLAQYQDEYDDEIYTKNKTTQSNVINFPNRYAVPMIELSAAAGAGAEVLDETVTGNLWFRRPWLQKHNINYDRSVVISVCGESMEPTLPEGCSILVDRSKCQRRSGHIYVMRTADGIVVKRLKHEAGRWLLKSDHPEWDSTDWKDDIELIGEVCWMSRIL